MASGAGRLTVASADESKPNSGKEEPQADERSKPPAGSSKSAKPKSRQKKVDPRPQTKKPANKDSNAAPTDLAVAGMKKIVVEVDIKDMSLEELAEWINRDTGANVIVRWKLLEKEGITRASKISVKARNINIRQLLALSFLHLTQSKPSVELSAQARGNTIIISTRKDHNSKMITRVYEVADLIQDMPDFPIAGSERGFSRSSKRRADKRLMHAGRGTGNRSAHSRFDRQHHHEHRTAFMESRRRQGTNSLLPRKTDHLQFRGSSSIDRRPGHQQRIGIVDKLI
ncbi:MAG: hypothetical protein IPK83_03820 [Planctomycetes bacterium]|nr:hypothetical protein [Planctomycetota bacterium]